MCSGVSIASIGRGIAYGLKAACLVFDIESTNEAIEHAHDAVRLRSIKKSANTNRKQTTKWKRDKKLECDFIRQMMKYDVPTSVQLNTMIEKTRNHCGCPSRSAFCIHAFTHSHTCMNDAW
jgi:hypothetical protein